MLFEVTRYIVGWQNKIIKNNKFVWPYVNREQHEFEQKIYLMSTSLKMFVLLPGNSANKV